jgi:hypothetical protein
MRYTETHVADLEDTLSQVAAILNSPQNDADALIRRARYVAAVASAAVNAIVTDGIRRAFERKHAGGYTADLKQVFARKENGRYESNVLQYAWKFFNISMLQALRTLADPHTTPEQLAECMSKVCQALNLPESESDIEGIFAELSK